MRRANGTGSIVKLKGKRRKPWWARVVTGCDAEGKIHRKTIGCYSSQVQASQALDLYFKNPRTIEKITLEEIYNQWAESHYPKVSEATKKCYILAWQYLKTLEDIPISQIKKKPIQDILDKNRTKSQSLLLNIKSLAKQLFNWAIENDYTEKNYAEFCICDGKRTQEKPVFSKEEVNRIWKHHNQVENADTVLILLYTGFRINEFLTLPIEKINLQEGYCIHGSKTEKGKDRLIPFPACIMPIIEKYYNENNEFLFERNSKKVSYTYYLRNIFNALKKELNLNPNLTPHSTRHFYTTMLDEIIVDKTDIQELVGHAEYQTTKRYTHKDIERLKNMVLNLPGAEIEKSK